RRERVRAGHRRRPTLLRHVAEAALRGLQDDRDPTRGVRPVRAGLISLRGRQATVWAAAMIPAAASIGIAKPMPSAPDELVVSMPMMCRVLPTIGPPLLPGLIASSVCRRPSRLSGRPVRSSVTVIERSTPDTMPLVTEPEYVPRGLPTASTGSPICAAA